MPTLDPTAYGELLKQALAEDIGSGDATSLSVVPDDTVMVARISARQDAVLSGRPVAEQVFLALDPALELFPVAEDGDRMAAGDTVLGIRGSARAILTGERTALNFLQRLSGIATLTGAYVKAAGGEVTLLDTRKTTPGWRALEKYAVRCGGGTNHRMGLFDGVMIKDNHLALLQAHETDLAVLVARVRARHPGLPVEIEIDRPDQLEDVLAAGPDWVLLDNMGPDDLRRCVALNRGRARLEASGGVTLSTIGALAATGVDAISVGALTHSAVAVDFGLDRMEAP